jgi:hypothetical protein
MTKEREYRAYAGTCVDLANKATSDENKKHLLAWRRRGSDWLIVFSGRLPKAALVRSIPHFGQSCGE